MVIFQVSEQFPLITLVTMVCPVRIGLLACMGSIAHTKWMGKPGIGRFIWL